MLASLAIALTLLATPAVAIEPSAVKQDSQLPKIKETLQLDQCDKQVKHLEKLLRQLKYLRDPANKCFNEETYLAVVAFQKWEGLSRDGIVGKETIRAIRKGPNEPSVASGGAPRRADVYLDQQVIQVIAKGKLRQVIPISSGAAGYSTPTGVFNIYRKEEMSWSNPYSVWMPWASYFTGGIAFHEADSVPVYPASHGCLRVPGIYARELYQFLDYGTEVRVL
jgi:peptidoglycan hydrolase-like protein with peptidoglycan-binding domain